MVSHHIRQFNGLLYSAATAATTTAAATATAARGRFDHGSAGSQVQLGLLCLDRAIENHIKFLILH